MSSRHACKHIMTLYALEGYSANLVGPKGVSKALKEGMRRLADNGTWKQWRWDTSSPPFVSPAASR